VATNDAARTIVGCRRRAHIHIGTSLSLPSLKEVADKAAMETWKSFYSNDRSSGARNRPMRSTTPVAYPLGRETATFVCHEISVWNMFKALRTTARVIGRSVPM
ncbi:Hypothetical protein FKW44_020892, partial [Caligus rogercresseyi]